MAEAPPDVMPCNGCHNLRSPHFEAEISVILACAVRCDSCALLKESIEKFVDVNKVQRVSGTVDGPLYLSLTMKPGGIDFVIELFTVDGRNPTFSRHCCGFLCRGLVPS